MLIYICKFKKTISSSSKFGHEIDHELVCCCRAPELKIWDASWHATGF